MSRQEKILNKRKCLDDFANNEGQMKHLCMAAIQYPDIGELLDINMNK